MASLASMCVDSNSTRMTEARVEGARSAIFFARQVVVIPFITYTHTLQHTNHPKCQSRLWVWRKRDNIEARVHSSQKTSSRWKNGVEVVHLKCFEETINGIPIKLLIGPLRAPRKAWWIGEDAWICYRDIRITYMLFKYTYVQWNSITYICCLKTCICCWTNMSYKPYMLNNKICCWRKYVV